MRRLQFFIGSLVTFIFVNWPAHLTPPGKFSDEEVLYFQLTDDSICLRIVQDSSLYTEGWDTLRQPLFWRKMMEIGPDTSIVNIAKNREIVGMISTWDWAYKSRREKRAYEEEIRRKHNLSGGDEIYFTSGRKHFYQFDNALRGIDKAVGVFMEEGTDPWYAQAILLIESPGKLQVSTEGAYGAFQLMEGVARDMGLLVNDTLDERVDFEKSAAGAARLLRTICLPQTRQLCQKYNLEYNETDLWFRLLVMHVYHAGIGNVARAMKKIQPEAGGKELILELWQTRSRRFGNASQNYSQIVLAALMKLDDRVKNTGLICPPEVMMP
ncbi:MAG: transglycosylase SLT domain-containing protein [Bacteroidia bacterium]|nr:transglycosylase SLT domain-containing protein [Bacteroidia bacterium]